MTTYQDIFKKGYTTKAPTTGNYATLKSGGVEYYKPITSNQGYSNVAINPAQKGATKGGVVGTVNTDIKEMNRLKALQTPTTPTTPNTPTEANFTPNYDFSNYSTSLTNYLNAIKPQTPEEKIKQQQQYYELLKQQYDPQIAAITAVYNDILARQQEASKGAIGQTRAMANAAGLAGTPMGQAQQQKTAERQAQIEKAIDLEKGVKIQQILGEAQIISQKMAEASVLERQNYAKEALQIQREAISQAKSNLFDLAKAGYGWDAQTKQLAEQAGYTEDLAEVLYKASMPTEGAIDWKTVNMGDGKVLFYGVNPQTGQLEQKTTDVNVPQGYKTTFANGQMYYVPEKNEEGDLTGAVKYESEADKQLARSKELERFKTSQDIYKAQQLEKMKGVAGTSTGYEMITTYSQERTKRTLSSVDELLKDTNALTTGAIGGMTKYLAGTSGRDFKAKLDTLKANIAFNELIAMREASKTGGALGSISEKELALLESALGALDQSQSTEQFKNQLNKIKESITSWQEAMGSMQGQPTENNPLGI